MKPGTIVKIKADPPNTKIKSRIGQQGVVIRQGGVGFCWVSISNTELCFRKCFLEVVKTEAATVGIGEAR